MKKMSSINDMPKEILIHIIKIMGQDLERDLIREIINLDERYKGQHHILSTKWTPCFTRYKPRLVYIKDNNLISRIIPIPKLPENKNMLLLMIQLINKQADNIIENKLFKLELGLMKCLYPNIREFEKASSPDFMNKYLQYKQEEKEEEDEQRKNLEKDDKKWEKEAKKREKEAKKTGKRKTTKRPKNNCV